MEKKRILLVEDEAIIAINIKRILETRGYDVVKTVTAGEDAVEYALSSSPDLILMDIMLKSEMDGITAAEEIMGSRKIPVIYMTAHSDDRTLHRAKATAPYGYVLKPVSPNELYSAVEVALFKHDMERRLRESEELHRLVLSNISDAVFITDEKGAFTFICPNVETIFGYTEDEIRSMGNITRLLGLSLYDNEDLMSAGELSNIGLDVEDKQGVVHTCLVNVKKVSIYGGSVLYTCRDVTDRREMEEDLRFQSMLLDRIGDHITATDLDGNIVYVNEAEAKSFNKSRKELIGANVRDYGEDPGKGATQEEIIRTTCENGFWQGRVVNQCADGEILFQSRTWLYHDGDGEPAGLVGISSDVTELARMEDELSITNRVLEEANDELLRTNEELQAAMEEQEQINEELQAATEELEEANEELEEANEELVAARNEVIENEQWFRALTEHSTDITVIMDKKGVVSYVSPSVERVFDFTTGDITGKNINDFIVLDKKNAFKDFVRAVRSTEGTPVDRVTALRGDGTPVTLEFIATDMTGIEPVNGIVVNCRDITCRVELEKSLEERENIFEHMVKNANDVIAIVRPDSTIDYINEVISDVIGYKPEEVTGKRALDFFHPDDAETTTRNFTHRIRGEQDPELYESSLVHKDGSRVEVEVKGKVMRFGGELRDLVIIRDVSQRTKDLRELRVREDRLSLAMDSSRMGMWEWRAGRGDTWFNDRGVELLGFSRKKLEKNATDTGFWSGLIHPDHRERVIRDLSSFASGNTDDYIDEFRIMTGSGEYRWFYGRARIIERDSDGGPARLLGVFQDVTEGKTAEKEINRLTDRLRTVIENMPVMLIAFNGQGRFIVWNRECERVTGFTAEEVIGNKRPFSLFYPDKRVMKERMKEILNSGHNYLHHLWDITCKDGSTRDILWSDISGQFPVEGSHSWAVGIDITGRTRALEKLIESEKKYHAIVDGIADAMYVISFDGEIVDVNGNACRMLGYERDELIGTSVNNIDSEKDRDRVPDLIDTVKREGKISITMTHYKKDGTPVPVSVSGRAVTGGGDGLFYAFARDITNLKENELMLKNSLREKEVLLKEVHHRVKNNLQVISSIVFLKSLAMEWKDADEILQDIQGRIRSISIIHEMLYRSENFAAVEFDEYINILTREIYQGHADRVTVRFHIDLEEVALDLERAIPCALVIYELVLNAVKHAFPGREEGRVSITGSFDDMNGYRIEIADNGVGLPEGIDTQNSETLGLELVHTLMEQLAGELSIERDGGTKFIIRFR